MKLFEEQKAGRLPDSLSLFPVSTKLRKPGTWIPGWGDVLTPKKDGYALPGAKNAKSTCNFTTVCQIDII